MSDNTLDPVTVTISGKHDTGRTTLANLLKMFLNENGYPHVEIADVEPLPQDQKDEWHRRFLRNRERSILIRIVNAEDGILLRDLKDQIGGLAPRASWIPQMVHIEETCAVCVEVIEVRSIALRSGGQWAHTSCVKR